MSKEFNWPLVYTAQSKMYFFCRDAVSEFTINQHAVPLHPFQLFGYFLNDRVPRDDIREANNTLVHRADQLWIFGSEISNGVIVEVDYALAAGKPIRYFTIAAKASEIVEIDRESLTFEAELLTMVDNNVDGLRDVLTGNVRFDALIKQS